MSKRLCIGFVAFLLMGGSVHASGGFRYQLAATGKNPEAWETVIGFVQGHTVAPGETILDIARSYGLGFNELELVYPAMDPWVPPKESRLLIPTQWVLPPTQKQGIVINIPEMRLYYFYPKVQIVRTYPIGIGDLDWETPIGTYRVVDRQVDPGWTVPKSLREKYGISFMPPGPENPLGRHWLGLSRRGYGIHGTNFPWAVGRLVTHGCIRLYPEHIEKLFPEVPVNTPVELIYEPIKIGFKRGEIYVEVHPDPYRKIRDLGEHARKRILEAGLRGMVSFPDVMSAVERRDGVPVRVGFFDKTRAAVAGSAGGGQMAQGAAPGRN